MNPNLYPPLSKELARKRAQLARKRAQLALDISGHPQ